MRQKDYALTACKSPMSDSKWILFNRARNMEFCCMAKLRLCRRLAIIATFPPEFPLPLETAPSVAVFVILSS